MKDAKRHKRSIAMVWIDLKNAFGSVKHNLIQRALQRYHIPLKIRNLVYSYYERLTAFIKRPLTQTFRYSIGVFQGCPLSPILFNICFQILLDSLQTKPIQALSYSFRDTTVTASNTGFADDLAVFSNRTHGAQKKLDLVDSFLAWSKMQAAPHKCRSYAAKLTNNKYTCFDPALRISETPIPALNGQQFKFLGRMLTDTVGEITQREDLINSTRCLLKTVAETRLYGHQKLWLYQHQIIPKIAWQLEILDLSHSFAKLLHRICLPFLKKWAGLPRPAAPAILFIGARERFGLRLTYIPTLWKQRQVIRWNIIKNSSDKNMANLYQHHSKQQYLLTRQYSAIKEMECAEAAISEASPTNLQQGRAGLGFRHDKQEKIKPRKQILNTIHEGDCQDQLSHLKSLQMQGSWLKWRDTMFEDLTWKKLLYEGYGRTFSFQLNCVLNTLPTVDNLRRWGNSVVEQQCPLCNRQATLRHILSACPTALHQGRYTWRHDNVLKCIVKLVNETIQTYQKATASAETQSKQKRIDYITFCKAGENLPKQPPSQRKRLNDQFVTSSADWQVLVDMKDEKLVFPHFIAPTTCRPDIVLFSKELRRVLWLELTVCSEDRFAQSREIKIERYRHLHSACVRNGWDTESHTAEVGARGAISTSLDSFARSLRCTKEQRRLLRRNCRQAALNSSYVLWLRRRERTWRDWPLY